MRTLLWAAPVLVGAAALADALGHLHLPVGKLVLVCICALLPYGQSKCNIDISVLAEDKWHWSIYGQG